MMSTQLSQIAKKAKLDRTVRFTSLAHLLTPEFLTETWGMMNRRAASGIDGESTEQFESELKQRVEEICTQLRAGAYRAPPVRRVEIPKGPGKTGTRPLGIPTVADRLLQRAVARIIEAVFEAVFLDCSYGFRPGRNPHHALQALRLQIVSKKVNHVFEADIRSYFTRISQISGAWMGTMQLTEPQAGSDVGALRTKAARAGDGSYRITGSKIFITYGEHDLTSNIIHFVLARLPDAPPGTKGVSLFLVPKVMPDGKRNDVRAHSVEHKLGIHGSPTCTMIYGDQGGATGYLIGEEHKGMLCMFTMMNRTRLAVGLQGVAIAELATQQALSYARERKQGAGGAIIAYPDVKRMLLTMRALTGAARMVSSMRFTSG